jgi:hypothetical protein
VLPDGKGAVQHFAKSGQALEFLKNQYRHCKTILVPAAARELPGGTYSGSGSFEEFPVVPDRLDRTAAAGGERSGDAVGTHDIAHFEFQPRPPLKLGVDDIACVEHDPIGSAVPCVVKPSHNTGEYRVR